MVERNRRFTPCRGSGLISSLANAAGTVVNRAIDYLPVEIHVPGYQYCGPGTDLKTKIQDSRFLFVFRHFT